MLRICSLRSNDTFGTVLLHYVMLLLPIVTYASLVILNIYCNQTALSFNLRHLWCIEIQLVSTREQTYNGYDPH